MKTEIKELKVNQLNINSKNPRKISEVSYRKLKKSLTEFKKNGEMITIALKGIFFEKEVREEFLLNIK
jgi:hypothetical protein